MSMMNNLGLFLLLLFCGVTLNSQVSYSIAGKLIDEEKQVIPYATLAVANDSLVNDVVQRLVTSEDGVFSFSLKKQGSYVLTASFLGKESLQTKFKIDGSQRNIDLGELYMQTDANSLSEVTVVGVKPLVKVEADKLVYNMSDDPEAKTSTALDMLRKVPLVSITGDDQIQVKGSGKYKILINGKPSAMFNNSPEKVLEGMPASSIKNVEVITEPGAKYDAEGVTALINIITEKNTTDGYTGTVGVGYYTIGSFFGNVYLAAKYGKIGITTNVNQYTWKQVPGTTSYVQKTFDPNDSQQVINSMNTIGESRGNGRGLYGNFLFSYEVDSLNLLSLSVNRYDGSWKSKSHSNVESLGFSDYSYDNFSDSRSSYGGTDLSLDYQKSFTKPDELLTISYKLGFSPYTSKAFSDIDILSGSPLPPQDKDFRTENETKAVEHTGQVDYVNPLTKIHTIETGVKYIHRNNDSDGHFYRENDLGEMIEDSEFNKNQGLEHFQDVFSGYGSYSYKNKLKEKDYMLKLGARFDYTEQRMQVGVLPTIKTSFFDIIPSALVSYQLSMTQSLKLSYNIQISRPGVWYLNPYEDNSNPNFISKGNPDLDTEKTHAFNFAYTAFNPKFFINASLGYSWMDNLIARVYKVSMDGGNILQTISTYDNIGKSQRMSLNLSGNWSPNPNLRFNFNANSSYLTYSINDGVDKRSTDGFQSSLFTSGTYNLPLDFRILFGGGFFQYGISPQTSKPFTNYFSYLGAMKELLNKKLSITLSGRNPFFGRKQTRQTVVSDPRLWSESKSEQTNQFLRIGISYRFGELKSSVKKVVRGIDNNDVSNSGGEDRGNQPQ